MNTGRSGHRARSISSAAHPRGTTRRAVARWHLLLCAIALVNVALWSISAVAVTREGPALNAESDAACHLQLLLAAVYVFGCAFRSVLPVYDIPRIVLVDSRLSAVMIGRSVATVAELCFAAQWGLILHRMALSSGSQFGQAVSLSIVPLIVVAEACSWYAVLTTEQRAHVFENSIWGALAALAVASMVVIGPHRLATLYPPTIAWEIGGAVYAAFIFFFDVPMYRSRWRADQTKGRHYLSIAQGVTDAWRRRVVSYRWADWKDEVLWMSLYFTFGVWSSISLVYASIAFGMQRN